MQDLLYQLSEVTSERQFPRQKLVQDYPDRIDVRSRIRGTRLTFRSFRGHVSWRSQHFPTQSHGRLKHILLSQPKIHHLWISLLINHDITGFQITVNYRIRMDGLNGQNNFVHHLGSGTRRITRLAIPLRKCHPINQFAADVNCSLVNPRIVNCNNIGMANRSGHTCFT